MRTHYLNGDDVGLTACGCDGCSPSRINGLFCHEEGCPEAWRDRAISCFVCGCAFFPAEQDQQVCQDCRDDA